jgi:hypothetical protein
MVATLVLVLPATADVFHDEAEVLDAQPVYEARRVPVEVQECGYEQPSTPAPVDAAQLGDPRAIDPGADLLWALQRDVELRESAEVYRCRMVAKVESRQELAGYQVRYEYAGRVYERRMAQPPGDTIQVTVALNSGEPETGRWR